MPLLIVDQIVKQFGAHTVLNNVSFSVEKGDVKVLIGPSGTGKSTLLRCVNMLAPPNSGTIRLGETTLTDPSTNLSHARQRIGMVFQHFALFKHLKAIDNVSIGLSKIKKLPGKEVAERAEFQLERVGLIDHKDKYPAELSGGQQQRVGIARALSMDPELILFDEPTSALDPELIGEVLQVMRDLAAEGMTMLVVTHEMGFAKSVANEIIFMEEGQILEQAPPKELFENPQFDRTKLFLSKISELYGE